jgi:hypothetical protein
MGTPLTKRKRNLSPLAIILIPLTLLFSVTSTVFGSRPFDGENIITSQFRFAQPPGVNSTHQITETLRQGDSFATTGPPMPAPASLLLADPGLLTAKSRSGAVPPTLMLSPAAAALQVTLSTTDPFTLFEPYTIYAEGAEAKAVGIGDFNHDSLEDVAMTTGWPENLLFIFTQDITGTLSQPITYTSGSSPNVLAIGDLNNDTWDDVVVANFDDDNIGVYLQQPDGSLLGPTLYDAGDAPNAIAIGDLNADGRDDVVLSHWSEEIIGVFTQKLDGTLESIAKLESPQAGWDDIDVGDLNGDGRTDVVKMNGQFPANPNLSVYTQNLVGGLNDAVPYDLGKPVGNGIAVGDVSGDGREDVVMSYGGNRPFSHIAVFSQTITGTLGVTTTHTALDNPEAVEIADLNADGRLDILVLHGGWSSLSVYLQYTGGQLGQFRQYALPIPNTNHYGPQSLAVGDLNNDSLPDVAIADDRHGLLVLYHRPVQYRQFFPVGNKPIPESQTPIFDDFSDPESGWPDFKSGFVDFEYLDDEYHILNNRQFVSAFATAGHQLINLDASVDGYRVGDVQGAYGIAFGILNNLPVIEHYAFIVWPDYQEWNVIRFAFGDGLQVLYWGVIDDINPGGEINRLRVLREGDALSFWVNNAQVLGTNRSTYTGSRLIGLIQFPLDVSHDARFDNYSLTKP